MRAWEGSANWTMQSNRHLEFGAWTTDQALASAVLEFITDVFRVSEPIASDAERPSPQLVEGWYDDVAFVEAADALREAEDDPDE